MNSIEHIGKIYRFIVIFPSQLKTSMTKSLSKQNQTDL